MEIGVDSVHSVHSPPLWCDVDFCPLGEQRVQRKGGETVGMVKSPVSLAVYDAVETSVWYCGGNAVP